MKYTFLVAFLFLIGSVAVVGCGSQAAVADEKAGSDIKELSEDQLFAGDIVREFLAGKIPYLNDANRLFMEGLDRYKNKKDPQGAIPLFVESICKNPASRSYYELGNVYMDTKDYKSSILCYQMAEKLGYEPFSKVLYNLACAHSMSEDYDMAADYLEFALQAGYSNMDNISKDPDRGIWVLLLSQDRPRL